MIDANYPALSHAIAGSTLWRFGTALIDAFRRAWRNSVTAQSMSALAPVRRLSVVAGIAAIAAAAAFAFQFAMPIYVRSGLPAMWPVAGIILLALVAASGSALERAWPHSTAARLLAARRLRP